MTMPSPTTPTSAHSTQSARSTHSALPPSHPLIIELSSLRQQLAQYQKASHQSSIQLQGSRLELSLLSDKVNALNNVETSLKAEVEVLRKRPEPPPIPPSSTALTELSLAHRRLSAKLDLTEAQLSSTALELASTQQELSRVVREREGDRATINDLRRIEEDREEEVEWERGERRKAEEQKKLCDLALEEYSTLVHSLDPSAVPPLTPTTHTGHILDSTPDLTTASISSPATLDDTLMTPPPPTSSAESISNLLIGQQGVHQLFNDFVSTLTAKEKALHSAHAKIEQLELSLESTKDQLALETGLRVTAEQERDKALRDDGSAAKVVERYMTFTQKTHATVHLHLDNLRARSTATQTSLRGQVADLTNQLHRESKRAEKLREALDEMSEGLSRESAGRRREIGLRLKMLAVEEKRERAVEKWLDRVRRARQGAEGAVIEPDNLEVLLDEGVECVSVDRPELAPKRSWKGFLGKKRHEDLPASAEEESLTRVLLAEELVSTLVQDLQVEMERRMELEKQRVDWLAQDAVEGVKADSGEEGHVVFELEDDKEPIHTPHIEVPDTVGEQDHQDQSDQTSQTDIDALRPPDIPATPSPLHDTPPLLPQLRELFEPLTRRYEPLQANLHSLAHSLSLLRESTPPATGSGRKPILNLSRRADATLITLLDSIHEVIEDARVDVEIALADEDRVFHGFEALLGVGKSGVVQGAQVLKDAREYVIERDEWEGAKKLRTRVANIESDLTAIKGVLHSTEGMIEDDSEGEKPWADVEFKTIAKPVTAKRPSLSVMEGKRSARLLSGVGNVGRSFSASVIGAPRRVGSFAGGLYKGPGKEKGEKEKEKEGLMDGESEGTRDSHDDVE